jgi:hypothetical protein
LTGLGATARTTALIACRSDRPGAQSTSAPASAKAVNLRMGSSRSGRPLRQLLVRPSARCVRAPPRLPRARERRQRRRRGSVGQGWRSCLNAEPREPAGNRGLDGRGAVLRRSALAVLQVAVHRQTGQARQKERRAKSPAEASRRGLGSSLPHRSVGQSKVGWQ